MRHATSLLVMLVLLGACRSLPFPEPELEGEYGKTLALWTRSVAIYSGLETRGFCRVVYLSPDFVDAQAKKISQMRAELPDEAQQTREKLRAKAATPTVFAVFYSPDKQSNDWNEKNWAKSSQRRSSGTTVRSMRSCGRSIRTSTTTPSGT